MALSSASSASAALRIFAGLELSWAQLEDAASLDVRERALQRSDRRRCIRPPILIRDDVGGVEAYAAVLNPDFKLAPLSDPQLPAHVDRQRKSRDDRNGPTMVSYLTPRRRRAKAISTRERTAPRFRPTSQARARDG